MREPGPTDTRQSDLARELGLDVCRMKRIRAEHLCSADWFTHGRGNCVWITAEGQRKLRIWAETKDDVPHVSHYFMGGKKEDEVEAWAPLPHPEWIEIRFKDGNGEWVKAPCRVPRRLKNRFTRGKPIRVEVVQSNSETGYRHESFAEYPPV